MTLNLKEWTTLAEAGALVRASMAARAKTRRVWREWDRKFMREISG